MGEKLKRWVRHAMAKSEHTKAYLPDNEIEGLPEEYEQDVRDPETGELKRVYKPPEETYIDRLAEELQVVEEGEDYSRPALVHDQGFLDPEKTGMVDESRRIDNKPGNATGPVDLGRRILNDSVDAAREATGWAQAKGAKWLRDDLDGALEAYEHWLAGSGESREVDYDAYLTEDNAGRHYADAMQGAMEKKAMEVAQDTSRPDYGCAPPPAVRMQNDWSRVKNEDGEEVRPAYPATENWQKEIGSHPAHVTGEAQARLTKDGWVVDTNADFYMEDMYNFNTESADVRTKQPDSLNGHLERTGRAKGYLQHGEAKRESSRVVSPGLLPPPLKEEP